MRREPARNRFTISMAFLRDDFVGVSRRGPPPTVLTILLLPFPALTRWANLSRVYGASQGYADAALRNVAA